MVVYQSADSGGHTLSRVAFGYTLLHSPVANKVLPYLKCSFLIFKKIIRLIQTQSGT